MITVKHVLKDGTVVDSVEGRMIKATDNTQLYAAVSTIKKEGGDKSETVSAPESRTEGR